MDNNSLKILNSLSRIDWKINRHRVNMGIKIVEKYYDDIDNLKKEYPHLSTTLHKLKYMIDQRKEKKAASKEMATSDYKVISDPVWKEIKPEVEKKSYEYKKYFEEHIRRLAKIYKEYEDMSREERKQKYPKGFFNKKGAQKILDAYRSTLNKDTLERILEKRRESFIDNEKAKLDKLAFRTIEKLGEVSNVRVGQYRNNLISIKVDTPNESNIEVSLEAISAGGYNIQRFHYRWLSHFSKDGKRYKVKA